MPFRDAIAVQLARSVADRARAASDAGQLPAVAEAADLEAFIGGLDAASAGAGAEPAGGVPPDGATRAGAGRTSLLATRSPRARTCGSASCGWGWCASRKELRDARILLDEAQRDDERARLEEIEQAIGGLHHEREAMTKAMRMPARRLARGGDTRGEHDHEEAASGRRGARCAGHVADNQGDGRREGAHGQEDRALGPAAAKKPAAGARAKPAKGTTAKAKSDPSGSNGNGVGDMLIDDLLSKGRDEGFITHDQILEAVPQPEQNLGAIEELYAAAEESGRRGPRRREQPDFADAEGGGRGAKRPPVRRSPRPPRRTSRRSPPT